MAGRGGGYRDELKALQARKDALEAEVEELREAEAELEEKDEQLRRQRKRIARLEAKLDDLEDELEQEEPEEEGEEEVEEIDVPPPVRHPPKEPETNPKHLGAALAVMAGVSLLSFWLMSGSDEASPSPGLRSEPVKAPAPRIEKNGHKACRLTSIPSGASVYGDTGTFITNGGEPNVNLMSDRHYLGSTPAKLVQIGGYDVELELEGYAKTTAHIPDLDVDRLNAPCEVTVTLQKN